MFSLKWYNCKSHIQGFQRFQNRSYNIYIVGINGLDKGIGPWAAPEDTKEPEDKQVLVKGSRLLGRGRVLVTTSRWCCPRRQTSSGNRVEAWSLTTQQVLGSGQPMLGRRISFGERRVNRELRNIWEKNCYHHIEWSAPNQLVALMWRWCLNSDL